MKRLVKLVVFSAVVAAGSLISAPKAAEAGYGYGYGYGIRSYGYYNSYYAPRVYVPTYSVYPSYGYGYYNNFCY
jgi:hypothetical protein